MPVTPSALVLILITLLAATVNGALGYGFSSITVPVALLFYTNRVLNPALVWIEVVLNGYVLWVNRASVPHVWRRVVPIILGLAQARHVRGPVAAHSDAGRRVAQAHQSRASRRTGVRRGPRRALLRYDDLRSAPGSHVEQPGVHQTGLPSRARARPTRRIDVHGRRVRLRRHVCDRERRFVSLHRPEPRRGNPAGRAGHSPRPAGNLPAHLHELRRLGRRLRHLDTIATAPPGRWRSSVCRARYCGPGRYVAVIPVLPAPESRVDGGGATARYRTRASSAVPASHSPPKPRTSVGTGRLITAASISKPTPSATRTAVATLIVSTGTPRRARP